MCSNTKFDYNSTRVLESRKQTLARYQTSALLGSQDSKCFEQAAQISPVKSKERLA